MKNLLILLCTFFLLFSCDPPTVNTEKIIIDLEQQVDFPTSGEEWVEEVRFIPLETKQDKYLGRDIKFRFNDEHILAVSNDKIFLFDIDGQLRSSFKKRGQGPGEYSRIRSLELVPDREEIMLYDVDQYTAIYYSFSGEFIKDVELSFHPTSVAPLNNGKLVCHINRLPQRDVESPYLYQLAICNGDGEITDSYFPYSCSLGSVSATDFSTGGKKGEYFVNIPFILDIQNITGKGIVKEAMRFSFGSLDFDSTAFKGKTFLSRRDLRELIGVEEKVTDLYLLGVTTNAITFSSGVRKPKPAGVFRYFNRKSGDQIVITMRPDDPSNLLHGFPIPSPQNSFGDFFAKTVDAINVKESLKSLTEDQKQKLERYQGFKELYNLKEEDNPVLILFKVKDF